MAISGLGNNNGNYYNFSQKKEGPKTEENPKVNTEVKEVKTSGNNGVLQVNDSGLILANKGIVINKTNQEGPQKVELGGNGTQEDPYTRDDLKNRHNLINAKNNYVLNDNGEAKLVVNLKLGRDNTGKPCCVLVFEDGSEMNV